MESNKDQYNKGYMTSCGHGAFCLDMNDMRDQLEEKERKLKEVSQALEKRQELITAFGALLQNVSKTFFFNPFQNSYKKFIKNIPEVKLAAIGEVYGVIDIWTIIQSDDIELRRHIASYHVEIMKTWDQIGFEFMTIPITDIRDIQELKDEELSGMQIFYEVS